MEDEGLLSDFDDDELTQVRADVEPSPIGRLDIPTTGSRGNTPNLHQRINRERRRRPGTGPYYGR